MATNVPNPGTYMAQLGTLFTDIRDRMNKVVQQNDYITSMGGTAFLTAAYPEGLGLSQADANMVIAALGNHNAVATGYKGGPPAPQLDYEENGSPLWGGQ